MTIPTERELIDRIERDLGPLIDRTELVKKRWPSEAAQLGARVAGLGTFLAGMPLDDAVRGMCEEALGGPLEPPPPSPRFASEAEAMAWAWGDGRERREAGA